MNLLKQTLTTLALLGSAWTLVACDPQRISELQPGVSTEADVISRFGQPEYVWNETDGARTLEFNRQPSGNVNYMITVGADGKLVGVRQVLTPANFARIKPGMTADEVRRLLGKPGALNPYPLKNEVVWDWRWLDGPNTSMIFSVTFGPDARVLRSGSVEDVHPGGPNGK